MSSKDTERRLSMNSQSALKIVALALITISMVTIGVYGKPTDQAVSVKAPAQQGLKGKAPSKSYVDELRGLIQEARKEIEKDLSGGDLKGTAVVRAVMDFVHDNSEHNIDDEYYSYFGKYIKYYKMLLAVKRGESDHKVHLSCGPRSLLMVQLLDSFGIYGRVVQIFSDQFEGVEGHRLVEVKNPETNSWELWDPDTNFVFMDKKSGERVDVMRLVFSDIESVVPVRGKDKGWDVVEAAQKKSYYKSVMFESNQTGQADPTIIVNKDRFDLDKVFNSGVKFEEWLEKTYRNARVVLLSEG